MSLRYEEYRALRKSRDLLGDLLNPQRRPKTIGELKRRASEALHHFPFLDERGRPMFSNDNFTEETK
jgi:hypothetical protein